MNAVHPVNLPSEVRLAWTGPCPVFLHVRLASRALTADELHTLAETVRAIEEFRATVIGELPELTP